ncbi:hypothetical protein CH304_00215 [Rhodococcus sp. 15-649-1-2]|nr:hypothetical protein [Rhodococcus sp. 15-649-1-2]OZE88029.1 hypothetical protein CH304_00215 [Rhodococcus sp. 15-649-1-2]
MALKDLDTFFHPDLAVPIRGKWYTIPSPDGVEGPRLRKLIVEEGLPGVEQIDEAIKVLGPAFGDMVTDKVPWTMILHAGRTALLHYGSSADIAEIHWGLAQLGKLVDIERVTELLQKPTTKK